MNNASPVVLAMALAAVVSTSRAWGQSSCSSDGVARPVALVERFISADCDACWRDARTPVPGRGELALDWILPAARGESAPLAAAATRDALARMKDLGLAAPTHYQTSRLPAPTNDRKLRVARGPAFKGYMGASIELGPGRGGPWRAWLLLVETLPAGAGGSPVARNLVRNALRLEWHTAAGVPDQRSARFFESRPMNLPEGAHPDRLRVVGWVEDSRGRLIAAAQSRCPP